MIQALAIAVLVLVLRYLLGGTAIDLGPSVAIIAPSVLALGLGWGLLSRAKWPYLADSVGVALLVPSRGLLCDALQGALPAGTSWVPALAAVASLGPVGFVLGRQVSSVAQQGVLGQACGWCVGELAVLFGLVGWLPGVFTGFVVAGVFAALVEMGRHRRTHRDGNAEDRPGWEALAVGIGLAVVAASLGRIVPAYSGAPVDTGSEVLLFLLVPAILVAWPTRILSGNEALRRGLLAVGCLTLGWALWKTRENLGLYLYNQTQVARTISMQQKVDGLVELGLPATTWHVWMASFAGWPAAALGLCLGALGRGAAGPFAWGVGLGWLGQSLILVDPDYGPERLMLAASGMVAVGGLVALNRRAVWLVPAGAAALMLDRSAERPAYDEIRRVGETTVEAFDRRLLGDVRMFRTLGPSVSQPDARRAYARAFSRRLPFVVLGSEGVEELSARLPHDHGHVDPGDADLVDVPVDPGHLGLTIAGVDGHAGHDPTGPEGSVGRMLRLFGEPGRAFVAGLGAEIVAVDMRRAGWGDLSISSAMPFSARTSLVLLDEVGSDGPVGGVTDDPVAMARQLEPKAFDTIVVAPERAEWPTSGVVVSREYLALLARALAPAGRCLAWIDTTSLSARALRSRIAAFGAVFGDRSAAFVEMRELDPPFVVLVGWTDDAGQLDLEELQARLPTPGASGRRSRLADLSDLAAHLLLDGAGMSRLADEGPVHCRIHPVPAQLGSGTGWAAVVGLVDPEARLELVIQGAVARTRDPRELFAGLATHGRYSYHVGDLGDPMVMRIVSDVDWATFDDEVADYIQAAAVDPQDPLLQLALAALLEPLARSADYGRFESVFSSTGAEDMQSWRLALLQAYVLESVLEEQAASQALERARRWGAPTAGD